MRLPQKTGPIQEWFIKTVHILQETVVLQQPLFFLISFLYFSSKLIFTDPEPLSIRSSPRTFVP